MATVAPRCRTKILCHCLGLSESDVREAVALDGLDSVREVMENTEAGSGCTACHAAIKRLIRDQCPASSSPTWVTR